MNTNIYFLSSKYSNTCLRILDSLKQLEISLEPSMKLIWIDHPNMREKVMNFGIKLVPCVIIKNNKTIFHEGEDCITYINQFIQNSKEQAQQQAQQQAQLQAQQQAQLQAQQQAQLQAQLQVQQQAQLQAQQQAQLQAQLQAQQQAQLQSQFQAQQPAQQNSQLESQLNSQLESQQQEHLQAQLQAQQHAHLQSQQQAQLQAQLQAQQQAQLQAQQQAQLQAQQQAQLQAQQHYQDPQLPQLPQLPQHPQIHQDPQHPQLPQHPQHPQHRPPKLRKPDLEEGTTSLSSIFDEKSLFDYQENDEDMGSISSKRSSLNQKIRSLSTDRVNQPRSTPPKEKTILEEIDADDEENNEIFQEPTPKPPQPKKKPSIVDKAKELAKGRE